MDKISIEELQLVVDSCYEFLHTRDVAIIRPIQNLIKRAKAIDESIKTYKEYETGEFIAEEHKLSRLAIMLLNSFGELFLDGGKLTIYDDDLRCGKATHANTYQLTLKDRETHTHIFSANPTSADKPYDFNTKFISQITTYADGNVSDTTKHAWDSFVNKYSPPARTLDFKSALWKKNHEHFVDYVVQLMHPKELLVFRPGSRNEAKKIKFIPEASSEEVIKQKHKFFDNYFNLLAKIQTYSGSTHNLSWDTFILNN